MLIQLYLYQSNWILDFLQYYLLSEFYFIVILLFDIICAIIAVSLKILLL